MPIRGNKKKLETFPEALVTLQEGLWVFIIIFSVALIIFICLLLLQSSESFQNLEDKKRSFKEFLKKPLLGSRLR